MICVLAFVAIGSYLLVHNVKVNDGYIAVALALVGYVADADRIQGRCENLSGK